MAEKQDRERFEELTSTLVKELQMAGFRCNFGGPTSASFSKPGRNYRYSIKFGYSGYSWWLEYGGGPVHHPDDFEELRKDIMEWVRADR